jgi:RNA polymerase-interacting CarD/CdnL/TRCF family regulator
MTKKLAYQRGTLLYHSSHGPYRVKDVIGQKESGKDQYFYSLESKQTRFKGARFLIDSSQVETSGFHPAISSKEANQILAYLKTSDPDDRKLGAGQPKMVMSLIQENAPWSFARVILIFSREPDGKAAKGKREMLNRAVRGLALELSFALEIPEEEAIVKMKKSLQSSTKANSWALEAVSNTFYPGV